MSELVIIIRPSFAKVSGDPCKAALFDHILYQIAKKAKGQPREAIQEGKITYYKTNEELTELMVNTWGLCKVRNAVNELITMGLLGRDRNPKFGADRTKHFYFGQDQCKKLLELCQKHEICLHNIGLTPEVTHLMILSNGNDEFIKCSCGQMINSSVANDKFIEAITKRTTKRTENKENNERKNEPSQQNSPVSTSEGSFIRSSNFSSSSSQETKPQIVLTEDEQRIVKFAQKDLFKAMPPEASEKLKSECAILAPHIKTQEQFDSLLGHVRAKLKAPYHLKNMVNALNDWLQTQEKKPLKVKDLAMRPLRDLATQQREMERKYYEKQASLGKRKAEMDGISGEDVTDAQIAATISKWARLYKDTEHEEEYQSRVAQIQCRCGLDNSTFFGLLYNAKDDTDYSGDKSMNSFFRMLDKQLGRKRVLA